MKITGRGVAAALLVLGVAGVCIRLGFWQLDRLEQRRARNAAVREALTLPPVPPDRDTLRALARDPEPFLNRRIRVRGRYDSQGDIVLRGRSFGGQPGVHVVTPLRLVNGEVAVLVNRGWAPAPDAAAVTLAPLTEPGMREVVGLLQPLPAGVNSMPVWVSVGDSEIETFQRLDLPTVEARTSYPVLPVYIQQLPASESSAGALRRVPVPELDEGSHLSYAVQWFSFAGIAIVGFLVSWLRRVR